jgi:hypothetical protein
MYSTTDVLKFLLKALGGRAPYASLMHLAFLAQYDIRGREARKYLAGGEPLARAEFYIHDGVFSNEVADASEELPYTMNELYIELVYEGPAPVLPPPVERRLTYVAVEYGGWKPWQLRRHIHEVLDLTVPEKRSDYAGLFVDKYFRAEGFTLKTKELLTGMY